MAISQVKKNLKRKKSDPGALPIFNSQPSLTQAKSKSKFNLGRAKNSELQPANMPKSLLYLTNVDIKYDVGDIKNYLTNRNIKFREVYLLNIKKPDTRIPKLSFKLVIEIEDFKTINNPLFWPEGLKVRPWIYNKDPSINNTGINNPEPAQKKKSLEIECKTSDTNSSMDTQNSNPIGLTPTLTDTNSNIWSNDLPSPPAHNISAQLPPQNQNGIV